MAKMRAQGIISINYLLLLVVWPIRGVVYFNEDNVHELFFLFPLRCRLRKQITFPAFPDQLRVAQSFAHDTRKSIPKTTTVAILVLPFVEPKRLFIQIPEQMKRLHAHIRSLDRALEQRPEVFQPVNMDMAAHVGFRVIDHIVRKLVRKAYVCPAFVRMHLDPLRTYLRTFPCRFSQESLSTVCVITRDAFPFFPRSKSP